MSVAASHNPLVRYSVAVDAVRSTAGSVLVITLTCDNCEKPFEVEDDARSGEKVSCPYCGDINRVPETGPGAASPSAPIAKGKPRPSVPEGFMPAREVSQPTQEAHEHEVLIVRQAMFRAHPLLFSAMVLLVLGGLSFAIAALVKTAWWRGYIWVGLAIALAGVVWWLIWWGAPHRWVKLIITNKRTIRQEGIIKRRTSEVLHRHIMNVQIRQTVLQRLLGVGSIAIDSAAGGSDPFQREKGKDDDGHADSSGGPRVEIEMDNVAKPYDVKAMIDKYRGI